MMDELNTRTEEIDRLENTKDIRETAAYVNQSLRSITPTRSEKRIGQEK
jgi:hypothetical protein